MIEATLALLTEHWIATLVFAVQLAIRPVVKHFGLQPDADDLRPWVRRYRNLPSGRRGLVDGVLLTINSLFAEWYIQTLVVPRLTGGIASQLFGTASILVGIGIGLSIGKAMTESDYSWYKHE